MTSKIFSPSSGSMLLLSALLGTSSAFPSFNSISNFPLEARSACSGNTATTRSTWCDFSIDTDYTTTVPDTGVTREYWLELTDATVAPDGVSRKGIAVNGSIPGPTLFADWGDYVKVHVTNSLTDSTNGTSIHFHGIRQNFTNFNDGVTSITQCPTPPGSSITYEWRAEQYGSSWYHSHFGLQAWMGVFGGIQINGPATADYDEDLGHLFLNDWDHSTVNELYTQAETSGPPTLDNGLINGTNVWEEGGYRWNTTLTSGTSYRLRLVNAAVDTHFKFSIDNHTLQVIASDLVPITPYTTNVLNIGMGQRYDVIITANQSSIADSFWLRAIPQSACSENESQDNIRGIIKYTSTADTPTTTGFSYTDSCDDETDNISPYLSKTVDSPTSSDITLEEAGLTIADNLFKWTLNSTSMLVDWNDPTLLQVVNGNTTWETSNAVIELPDADVWTYLVIETTLTVPHPMHLHGHDFFVLAQGSGTFDLSSTTLNLDNPPRRDTAMLPASGHLVIAFQTDNPGAWLFHCHIGWHTDEGFDLQFVERYDEIAALVNTTELTDNCAAWSSYQDTNSVVQDDSGV